MKKDMTVDPSSKQKQGYKEALMKDKEKAGRSEDKDTDQGKMKDKEEEGSSKQTSSDEVKEENPRNDLRKGLEGKGKKRKGRTEKGRPNQKWTAKGKGKKEGEKEEKEGPPGLDDQKDEENINQAEDKELEGREKEEERGQKLEAENQGEEEIHKSPLVPTLSKEAAEILDDCAKKIAEAKMGFPEYVEVSGAVKQSEEFPSIETVPIIETVTSEETKSEDMEVVEAAEILFKARAARKKQAPRKGKKGLQETGKRRAGWEGGNENRHTGGSYPENPPVKKGKLNVNGIVFRKSYRDARPDSASSVENTKKKRQMKRGDVQWDLSFAAPMTTLSTNDKEEKKPVERLVPLICVNSQQGPKVLTQVAEDESLKFPYVRHSRRMKRW
ncbi:hypothetical protein CBR_g54510 [Chara braunii]|uniref:Uncharacterized protein n=1 Tax=Chara braunii TaxID=69332 RepID=A0A388MCG8_CHABU|nr:hypothetical protein CBR_g54510 [Chara braunii]|eukprot:GBG92159.1 hypothetical protein CBR_g54510 [Chara braunii]